MVIIYLIGISGFIDLVEQNLYIFKLTACCNNYLSLSKVLTVVYPFEGISIYFTRHVLLILQVKIVLQNVANILSSFL